jgi:hypothetical protein
MNYELLLPSHLLMETILRDTYCVYNKRYVQQNKGNPFIIYCFLLIIYDSLRLLLLRAECLIVP